MFSIISPVPSSSKRTSLEPHPLDPNYLDFGLDYEHYILGDDHGDIRARVDAEDHWYFSKWRWAVKYDKRGKKAYLYRTVTERTLGIKRSLFLHVAIKERHDPVRPHPDFRMVDHKNGNSLDCRRCNLEYATPSMNCNNRRSEAPRVNGKYTKVRS